jgi:L-ascorbate metabolism protein UlaG (beta-lactamase superfamily)
LIRGENRGTLRRQIDEIVAKRNNTLQLTWLGAAGFRIETNEGAVFLLDPFLSRPTGAIPPLPLTLSDLYPVDEIFLSNSRFDRVWDTPALVEQTGAIVHAPAIVCHNLAGRGVSTHNLQPVTDDKGKQIGSLRWQALPLPQPASEPLIAYHFQSEGRSLLYLGSVPGLEAGFSWPQADIIFLPLEQPAAAGRQAIQAVHDLQPKVVIPHHWDDYNPPFTKSIDVEPFNEHFRLELPQVRLYWPVLGKVFSLLDLGI